MPFLIAALGLAAAVYFFVIRARNAAEMTSELMDVANDVRLAARRFGFKRKTNLHPAEAIDDPRIGVAAIGSAFVEMNDLPTKEQRDGLTRALASTYAINLGDAEELSVLGRWIMQECGGPEGTVSRCGRKLHRMGRSGIFENLMAVIQKIAEGNPDGSLSDAQKGALEDILRAFKLS